jgi:hypothetical protein
MRYLSPFRIAAYLLSAIFLGHTGGGMLAQRSLGTASDGVFTAMKAVHFNFNGADATWYGFWFGFGLTISVYVLFSVIVAWQLDKVAPERWPSFSAIAWTFAASQLANAILSWRYFFVGPAVLSLLAAALIAVGAYQKGRRLRRLQHA